MRRALLPMLLALPLAGQTRLSLREALDQAAKLNPSVQTARLRALESKAQADAVRSRLAPQVSAVVAGTYATTNFQGIGLLFPGIPSRVGPFRTFTARPTATQTVLDLSLVSEVRAAREQTKRMKHQHDAAREETLLAVLQLYLQALQAESRVTAAEARLKTAETILAQTRDLEAGGAASKLDIARAEQRAETERSARIEAQRDRDVLVTLLVETIGLEPGAEVAEAVVLEAPAVPYAAASPGEALEAALSQRAELRAAEAQARAAYREQQAASRQRFPKLQAFGDYGVLGQGPDRSLSTYAVGASVTFPLWTGRRIESQIAEAAARTGQAEQELRRAKLGIAQEVRQAQVELEASRQATTAAERAAAAARTSLELARLRFSAGLAANIDTIVAQGTLAEAEDREIRARYDMQLARARLARAQGDVYLFFE